jgi:hypothetical protein
MKRIKFFTILFTLGVVVVLSVPLFAGMGMKGPKEIQLAGNSKLLGITSLYYATGYVKKNGVGQNGKTVYFQEITSGGQQIDRGSCVTGNDGQGNPGFYAISGDPKNIPTTSTGWLCTCFSSGYASATRNPWVQTTWIQDLNWVMGSCPL